MRKHWILGVITLLLPVLCFGFSEDWGFNWDVLDVPCEVQVPVMISSSALSNEDVREGVGRYKFREIVNMNSGSSMILFPSSSTVNGQADYTVFSTTYSIVLASATNSNVVGGSWKTYGQGAIFGIWNACNESGGGAGGSEHY